MDTLVVLENLEIQKTKTMQGNSENSSIKVPPQPPVLHSHHSHKNPLKSVNGMGRVSHYPWRNP